MAKQNNKGVVALLILFVITTVILGSYIIYDKMENNEKANVDTKVAEEKTNTSKEQQNVEPKRKIQQVSNESKKASVLVDTEGNAYFQVNDSDIQKQYKTYTLNGYSGNNGEKQLEAYKLNIQNVLKVYCVSIGNGGSEYFIFIKENGTLSFIEYNDTFPVLPEVKDIKNLSNVKSIVQENSMNASAVTTDGKKVNLYDYLNEI